MKLKQLEIKELITRLGFKPQEGDKDIYYKNYPKHHDYIIKINFEQEKIEYGNKIEIGDKTTSHFENSENFVVLECVDRVLEKGYPPDRLSLEHKWPMGRKEKGKLDILVSDKDNKAYLMIECKTWGEEYEKEKKKMRRDGGQLFSYYIQDKSAQYLCLYASRFYRGEIEFVNDIVKVDEQWRELSNQKEIFDHWNKNFKDNGIFEEWANAYDVEIKALIRSRLKELTEEDSGRIFNQFAEILRHNVVSDKPNAFNKIFNLFLCKIVDEDRKPTEELRFQWLESDTDEELQKRLSDLYKQGMKEYLTKEVTDYNDEQIAEKLYALDPEVRDQIKVMFTRVRLHKNNEFAFKEVFDEKSFRENAIVVREVIELLQPYQIRYGHKQQFLGDFFELLLSTGIKQEAGQFFTPVPIAKFIISSLPIHEIIEQKIDAEETNFLPYIIDFAAGSGHFLTEAMDEVQKIIQHLDPEKQRPSIRAKLKSWREAPFDWCFDYVYGIEADYRLVKTAKVSCFLNGDGLANVIHADGLDHFQKSVEYKGKLKEISQDSPKDNEQFDILVANPPYSVSAFKNTLKFGEESFELFNRLTDDSSEIECLFIERTKQLLKPGGWAGIILPSSILNNAGIYTAAREIILKYFDIKAIAEFGSNTFMATGTNTITLFLERKPDNDWKKIDSAIKNFFNKPKEATVNSIEKAFSKYVEEVFDGIELSDYISLVNKMPNETMQKQELWINYNTWFDALTEVKQLKEKKAFKDKNQTDQQSELDKLFYEKIFDKEQDRMLYFFLVYSQQTVILKTNKGLAKTKEEKKKENQEEKDFIGYEFSNRRGHEGIKMYRNEYGELTTKLYDEKNHLNPDKANSYIYHSFLKDKFSIEKSLTQNISIFDTLELMDIKKLIFEKSISLGSKKVAIDSRWPMVKLGALAKSIIAGGDLPQDRFSETQTEEYTIPIYSNSSQNNGLYGYTDIVKIDYPCVTISARGTIGYVVERNEKFYPIVRLLVLEPQKEKAITKYLELLINKIDFDISAAGVPQLSVPQISDYEIPLPPISIQEKIATEINAIEQKERLRREELKELKEGIERIFLDKKGRIENYKLSEIATLEYGKALPKSQRKAGDYPVMGSNGIDGTHNEYLIEAPCIIVGRKGSAGKINFVTQNCYPIDTTFYVKYDKSKILIKYLYYLLKELDLEMIAKGKGIGVPGLNRNNVHDLRISIHPLMDQNNIINKIEELEIEIAAIENDLSSVDSEKEEILKKYLE